MKELFEQFIEKINMKEEELKRKEEKIYINELEKIEKKCRELQEKYKKYKDILVKEAKDRICISLGNDINFIYELNYNGFINAYLAFAVYSYWVEISQKEWDQKTNQNKIKTSIKYIYDKHWEKEVEQELDDYILKQLKNRLERIEKKENELRELEKKLG